MSPILGVLSMFSVSKVIKSKVIISNVILSKVLISQVIISNLPTKIKLGKGSPRTTSLAY